MILELYKNIKMIEKNENFNRSTQYSCKRLEIQNLLLLSLFLK